MSLSASAAVSLNKMRHCFKKKIPHVFVAEIANAHENRWKELVEVERGVSPSVLVSMETSKAGG